MAAGIISYVTGISPYLASQKRLLTPQLFNDSIKSVTGSAVAQIQALSVLSPEDATHLNTAISNSTLPQSAKTELASVVMRRLSTPVDDTDSSKGQVMMRPYNYARRSDIAYFRDLTKSNAQVAVRMRQLLKSVGCVKPSENTYGAAASFLAALREPDMTSVALYGLVQDLKQAAATAPNTRVEIQQFPASPKDLPEAVFTRAYSVEPPEALAMPEFQDLYDRCPQRRSHSSLRAASAAAPRFAPANRGANVGDVALCDASVEQIMMQFVEKHMREPGQVASQSRPGTMLAIEDRLAASSAPLVATDTRAAEARNSPHCAAASAEDLENVRETEARDGGCTEDADDIVRQMEAVAIGGGTTKKRPAAALKRPAAALKRPAAAPTKISVSKPTKTKVGKFAMKVSKPTKSIIKKGGKCIRLGCSRCRGSSRGCASCRNPAFQGTRFQGASHH